MQRFPCRSLKPRRKLGLPQRSSQNNKFMNSVPQKLATLVTFSLKIHSMKFVNVRRKAFQLPYSCHRNSLGSCHSYCCSSQSIHSLPWTPMKGQAGNQRVCVCVVPVHPKCSLLELCIQYKNTQAFPTDKQKPEALPDHPIPVC